MPSDPRPGDFYRRMGGALFARLALLLDDEALAREVARQLFLRFVTRRVPGGDAGVGKTTATARPSGAEGSSGAEADADAAAEIRWVYRVGTNAGLQQLADAAVPGGGSPADSDRAVPPPPPGRRALPTMAVLRRLDELHANARVLADLDGLSVDEITGLLLVQGRQLPDRLRKSLRALEVAASSAHPSRLALDLPRRATPVIEHLVDCAGCARAVARGEARRRAFADSVGPAEVQAMAAAIAAARGAARRRRRGARQAVIVTLALLAVCALALLVVRPRAPSRAEAPYAGLRGASRTKASGMQIYVRRADGIHALDPEATVHPGDRLLFRARVEHPRFLELRARQGNGTPDRRVFPPVPAAAPVLVTSGEYLTPELTVAAGKGNIAVVGRFADHVFPLDGPPGPDVEVVPVRIEVAPE
jgi:hypothetical protein